MLAKLIGRLRGLFARLFRRAPPRPGYWVNGRKFSWSGRLRAAPWLWPAREYLLYVPRGFSRWRRRTLVVLIHGCKQTPEVIAAGTRIAALADENDWLVLLPRQSDKANPWSCWNWFDRATSAGRGEAAIVAAQVKEVRWKYRAHRGRVFVAGMSAGGTLAATLGVRFPELFAGVFVHSGLACGAASGPAVAMKVSANGPDTDPAKIGARARVAAGGNVRMRLLAVHGARDEVVAPVNAHRLVEQYRALNGLPPGTGRDQGDGDLVRLVLVPRLGHAWSGGDAAYPYNDPAGPDAALMLAEFVQRRG